MTKKFEKYLHAIQELFEDDKFLPVCVKILEEEPQWAITARRFCSGVLQASKGERIIIKDFSDCFTPITILGFDKPEHYAHPFRISPAKTKAIILAPLGQIEGFDVVLFILTPRQAMDLALAIYKLTGQAITTSFSGTSAVCGEATSRVYMTKRSHITLLCNGARLFEDFPDEYLVQGIPAELLDDLIEIFIKMKKDRDTLKVKIKMKKVQ